MRRNHAAQNSARLLSTSFHNGFIAQEREIKIKSYASTPQLSSYLRKNLQNLFFFFTRCPLSLFLKKINLKT
jgi:hypothetical protein